MQKMKCQLRSRHTSVWCNGESEFNQPRPCTGLLLKGRAKRADRVLFDITTKHIIHGACGNMNLRRICIKDGQCTKKFLRNLVAEMQTGEDE